MKKLLFVALVAVGMTACVQNEELALPKSTATIAFEDAYVPNATKADPTTTTESLTGFDVWAYMDEVAGTVLTDEDVTKVGGKWGYTNIQYWMPDHTYYFAALAPMNSANVKETLAGDPDAKLGLGEIAFTNVNGTEDLLYAKKSVSTPNLKNLTEQGMNAVKLEFQHLLSKVRFTFHNGFTTPNMKVVVSEVKMTAPAAGTINLAVADYTEGWNLGADANGETVRILNFGDVAELAATASAPAADELLTIPATTAYTYNVAFKVKVYSGSVLALETEKEATISGYALEMGKAYNFTAAIDWNTLALPAIEFTAEVKEWDTPEINKEADYYYDAETNTYSVATATGLQEVVAKINGGELTANVLLMNDIVLPATRSAEGNWTPIGLSSDLANGKTYTGTFDGNNHTIENMVCKRADVAGLIGYTYSATVKNVTIKNATISSNHFAAGIVAWVNNLAGNTKKPFVVENCHVLNSAITSTPELVNGAYDNGDKVGGLIGAAWISRGSAINEGTKIANCSVKNTTVKAYRDLGGLFGLAEGVYAENCVLENVTVEQDLTNGYKDEVPTTVGAVIGRDVGNNVINGYEYVSTAAALAAALTSDKENIAVALVNDIDCPISSLGQMTGGSGEYKLGGEQTKNITIDLAGNKLNITTTYWSVLGAKNADALFTIKNGTMTSSQATGTWNSYDLCFANCNYNFENVVFEKAIALEAANKAYNLKNVSITETHDYYAIWVSAKGQNITINGLNVESAGRGIKIDEQYISAPAKVTMSVANATFKTIKKAAIVVKSVAGAEINWGAGNDITEVAADDTFAVWVDENSAAYADLVVVNGAPSKVEGTASVLVYTAEDLNNLKATNAYVVLKADIDFQGAAMTKPIELWKNSTFDGNGHKISNVKTAVQGGYATSLFRGDANPGNKVVKNLVIENLSTPAGYSYAAAIWSDLQGANIEIDNVHINNSAIAAKGTIGGFVGFVSGSTTYVVIKNSSINNTNLNGGEADHKRGAVVGRAYGCAATCENVVVENVKINDVVATTSTLVGDKGYTGTVTVK